MSTYKTKGMGSDRTESDYKLEKVEMIINEMNKCGSLSNRSTDRQEREMIRRLHQQGLIKDVIIERKTYNDQGLQYEEPFEEIHFLIEGTLTI